MRNKLFPSIPLQITYWRNKNPNQAIKIITNKGQIPCASKFDAFRETQIENIL